MLLIFAKLTNKANIIQGGEKKLCSLSFSILLNSIAKRDFKSKENSIKNFKFLNSFKRSLRRCFIIIC